MPWDGSEQAGFTSGTPWLPIDPAHRALSVAHQVSDAASTLALVRRLLGLRRSLDDFGASAIAWIDAPGDVLAFDRVGADCGCAAYSIFRPRTTQTYQHRAWLGASRLAVRYTMAGCGWRRVGTRIG